MNFNEVLIKPLLTEKSNLLREKSKFCFAVHSMTTKIQIMKAIEVKYNVKPLSCNIIKVKGKPKRQRFAIGKTSQWKKAIITLKKGDGLSMFEGV